MRRPDDRGVERAERWWTKPTIIDEREIMSFLLEIEHACRFSVDIFVTGSRPLTTAEATLERLLARGIRVRCIYERALVTSHEGMAYLARWRELGERQRVIENVPLQATIIDRTTVCVPVTQEGQSITSLLTVEAGLGEGMAHLFDLLWDAPIAREPYVGRSVEEQELAILTLMCDGSTDEQIARALAIGVRTVQRRLADLAQLMDAPSRAALAARAVAFGLVTPFAVREPSPMRGDDG